MLQNRQTNNSVISPNFGRIFEISAYNFVLVAVISPLLGEHVEHISTNTSVPRLSPVTEQLCWLVAASRDMSRDHSHMLFKLHVMYHVTHHVM